MAVNTTTGFLSPQKAIGKRLVPLYSSGHIVQVAALQAVMSKSPEYSPTSASPPRTRVVGWKVDHGKELRPPLDCGERESVDSNPSTGRRFLSPPAIRGPPEINSYTDSSKEEEDEKDNIAALREQLAALKLCLNNMNERMAESEMDCMDLDDKMDTHCKVVCSKIKCLAKATGNKELYRAPNPRI